MLSDTSQSMTVGAAFSSEGTPGTWSQSGTSTTTSGVSFTWASSTYYRDYRVILRYGKFKRQPGCADSTRLEQVRFPTGGYATASLSGMPSWSNCQPMSAGTWVRSSGSGIAYSLSSGVKIAPVIGINLSLSTQYGSNRKLYYYFPSPAHVCGDNQVPTLSSRVRGSS